MKLGIDATFALNTDHPAEGAWASPAWEEVDGISDLTENTTWDKAEIVIRRSLVKFSAKTVADLNISFKLLRETDNDLYDTILNALRTRDTVDILCLDGPIDEEGSEGFRYIAQVDEGGGSQNTGDALYRDIVLSPYPDATNQPQWATVGEGGTISYDPITPE